MAETTNILTAILAVFMQIANWIGSAITALIPIFWSSSDGLTFIGVLSVSALAISVIFLMIGLIQKFLHFRG